MRLVAEAKPVHCFRKTLSELYRYLADRVVQHNLSWFLRVRNDCLSMSIIAHI